MTRFLLLPLAVIAALALACTTEDASRGSPTPFARSTTTPKATSTPPPPSPTSTPASTPAPPSSTPARTSSTPTPTSTPPPLPPGGSVALGQRVTLGVGDEVAIAGTGWRVLFGSVLQDSRCPIDVTCIQAGSVTLAFVAAAGDTSYRVPVTLEAGGAARVALGEHELTLHTVAPAPLASRPTQPGDYRATISIDRPSSPALRSGIDGLVTLGPLCPVVREDQPCPDRPFEADLVIRSLALPARPEVTRVRSDAAGRFALDLPAGRYLIEPQLFGGRQLPSASPLEVMVIEGRRLAVLIEYDSGIR